MVEPPQNVASGSHKPLTRTPSTRTLSSTGPAGARPKLSRSATVVTKPASKVTKTSPGRGLTLRIEDDMQMFSMQSIRSAPAKSIRRLPPVPAPPMPVGGSHQYSLSDPPFTAPVGHTGEQTTFRTVRPLPSPPVIPTTPSRAPIRHSSPRYTPSTARQAAPKPLPVPDLPIEPLEFSRPSIEEARLATHRQTMPNMKPPSETPPPLPLPRTVNQNTEDAFQSTHKVDEQDVQSPDWDSEDDDDEEAVIQLGNRIVLRTASTVSLHSDLTSDEEEAPPPVPPLVRKVIPLVSKEEKEEHADYAWVLSNRMLYRQQSPQIQSKWIREKKGKRYTEQDYENIIQALRSL